MARLRRYLNRLNGCEEVNAAVEAHAEELPHLELLRPKLLEFLQLARQLTSQQGSLTASKQEATRRLRKVIRQGEAVVDVMRTGARQHYGNSSETLVEFGVQPFRGRPRRADEEPPETPTPENPESPTPTPTPE
jgi:hypothetical protein